MKQADTLFMRLRELEKRWEEKSQGVGGWCCATAERMAFGDCAIELGDLLDEHEKDNDEEDICGLCGSPGADKYHHPVHWPTERIPDGPLVHAQCEDEECRRAHQEFINRVGMKGVNDFLSRL